jgi:hypothetical protein
VKQISEIAPAPISVYPCKINIYLPGLTGLILCDNESIDIYRILNNLLCSIYVYKLSYESSW